MRGQFSSGAVILGAIIQGEIIRGVVFRGAIFLEPCCSYDEEKVTRYVQGNVYFGITVFICLSSTKLCPRFLLIYFARELKNFYRSSFGN